MLSARELSTAALAPEAQTWQNIHLVYTHGYGAVAAAVNEIQGEGLPRLLLQNIPPETTILLLNITRPEIYYGETVSDYVFVNSGTAEFDHPAGQTDEITTTYSYQGKGGVALS